jgi:hypothetical protein
LLKLRLAITLWKHFSIGDLSGGHAMGPDDLHVWEWIKPGVKVFFSSKTNPSNVKTCFIITWHVWLVTLYVQMLRNQGLQPRHRLPRSDTKVL